MIKEKGLNIIVSKGNQKNRTSETNDVPIDLNNKGIGPIKNCI